MKTKVYFLLLIAAFIRLATALPTSKGYTYCISEKGNCDLAGLNCEHCHSLMWYVNNSGYVLNDSVFYFLSGNHYLNSSNQTFKAVLNVSNVANLTLKGNQNKVTCKGKQTGLVFYNSSEIVIMNLEFINCGVNVNSSLQTSLFFELTNHIKLYDIAVRNSTGYGLYMNSVYGFLTVDNSEFDRSELGNAMFQFDTLFIKRNLINSTLQITSSNFTNGGQLSSDDSTGLSIYLFQPHYTVKLSNLVLRNNSGKYGGNIAIKFIDFSQNTSQISIENSTIENGVANNSGGGLLFTSIKQNKKDESSCTTGCVQRIVILKVTNTMFTNNTGLSGGGALIAYHENAGTGCIIREVVFENCNFMKNTANRGAIMYVTRHELPLYLQVTSPQFKVTLKNCNIYDNRMRKRQEQKNQDGIVQVLSVKEFIISNTNFVDNNGTALVLLNSAVRLFDTVAFENNSATYGGAIRICENSRMYFNNDTRIQFLNNSASQVGGAIYIGNQCLEETPPCFYQLSSDNGYAQNTSNLASGIMFFDGNQARYAGHALYGGSVENCFTDIELNQKGYYESLELFKQTFDFGSNTKPSLVTSDPYGVCQCKGETNKPQCENRTMYIDPMYPGQYHSVYVSAVGQLNGAVPAHITVNADSKNDFCVHLRTSHKKRHSLCKTIFFTVYLKKKQIPKDQIEVKVGIKRMDFLTESSNYYKIPKLNVNLILLPCPFVFELDGYCKCPEILTKHSVTCDIATQTTSLPSLLWISVIKNETTNKYQLTAVSSVCKPGRCQTHNLTLSQSNFSDICVTGRTGRLCGACASNYSLTLGPLKCVESDKECSASATVLLVLVFILAGILIIFFTAFFNLTVAEGTINGLLFYANCVHANIDSHVFKSTTYYFPKVFISWLNLDFGFEVCFYAGMTAYQKIWLEFGFLLYLLLLGVMIVCLSRRFVWFTRLAGRNVVPVLATVALFAYPKLIRLCIASLYCEKHSSEKSWYSDGISHLVWKLNENYECFSDIRIVLVAFAIIMFLVSLIYMMCLLLIQCLLKGSACCVLRWVDKLRPFFDAYTGPCHNHYRFWPGFLLFIRLGLYLLYTTLGKEFKGFLLTAICVFTIFLAFVYPKGVYKKWALNVVEFLFLLNLTIISIILSVNGNYQHTYEGSVSIGFAMLMLFLIISYNCYRKISKTRCWVKIMSKIKWQRNQTVFNGPKVDENAPLIKPTGEQPPLVDFSAPREELLYDD